MSSLKAKIFAAAAADAGLQALLGTNPFRWWDSQLLQSSAFPAVSVFVVSNPSDYVITGRMSTSWARVQFTVYGTGNDSENADAVVNALTVFLSKFNAIGVPGLAVYPNRIVNDRDGGIAETQPLTYQRFIDVMILNDENVA